MENMMSKSYTRQIIDNLALENRALSERAADLLEENSNLSESVKTLRAEVAQLTEQLAGAARVLITVEQERDELRVKLNEALGIARGFVAERDEARLELQQAQATAKSNGEMWEICHRQHAIVERDMLEASETIRRLSEKVVQLERETKYFQSTDYAVDQELKNLVDWREADQSTVNKNVGIRHSEYEGEYETPLGQALDGRGDEVEP